MLLPLVPLTSSTIQSRRRRIALVKGLEKLVQHRWGNANTRIFNHESHCGGICVFHRRYIQDDAAILRKLDRIAQEIAQDLSNAAKVTLELQIMLHIQRAIEVDLLVMSRVDQRLVQVADKVGQAERSKLELNSTSFNAREVEDVVYDEQEVLRGDLDAFGVLALFLA